MSAFSDRTTFSVTSLSDILFIPLRPLTRAVAKAVSPSKVMAWNCMSKAMLVCFEMMKNGNLDDEDLAIRLLKTCCLDLYMCCVQLGE
jgi:hypothetical protein